ncbi:MAG: ATP synthase F1 subunit delta [Candidatus Caenarcaniphilales bacterium]|nr:ATP synthase F1 subunit delta [Candidatus Caenarcaniphilales bacterium]
MSKYSVCHAYAKAIYGLLQDQKVNLDDILLVLNNLYESARHNDELKHILKDPFVTSAFKIALLYRLVPELEKNETLKKLVCLLADKKNLELILELAPEFEKILNLESNVTEIEVVSPNTLSESQRSTLQATLEKTVGGKVKLKTSLDESLIAGLVVKTEQYILDNSAKGRLNKMKRLLLSSN